MHKCRNLRESGGIYGKMGWYIEIEADKWNALNRKLSAILLFMTQSHMSRSNSGM